MGLMVNLRQNFTMIFLILVIQIVDFKSYYLILLCHFEKHFPHLLELSMYKKGCAHE